MAVVRNELRADLRITGENAVKAGLKGVGNAAENAGDDLRQMGKDAGYLQRQLLELKATQLALIKSLNETGDVTLIKDIKKARREVRQFERLSIELAGESTEVGIEAGAGLAKGMATGFSAGGPALIAAVIAAVGALLPGLGAIVSGAVSGVTGTGGIIGGIVAAAHDPQVKSAFVELGPSLGAAFRTAGEPMVAPLVQSLGVLKSEGQSVANALRGGFSILAPELVPLTKGLTGLVKEMLPGLLSAFESSRPVLRAISAELPKIGHAIGEFFRITTEDSDSAVLGFVALSKIIQNTLIYGAKFIAFLGDMYKGMVVNSEAVTELGLKTTGWLAATGPAGTLWVKTLNDQHKLYADLLDDLGKANVSTGALGSSTQQLTLVTFGLGVAAEGAAEDLKAQRDAMLGLVNLELDAIGAAINFERALDGLSESVKENSKTLDIHEEAGRRNVETIEHAIRAVIEQTQAEYNLARQHGATEIEAQKAADTLREKLTKELTASAVAAFGNSAALQGLLDKLNELNGKRVTYTLIQQGGVTVGAKVDKGTILAGVDDFRASGGPVEPHKLYRVNESGVELLATGSQGGHVYNAQQTAAMMSGASGGSTARPVFNFTLAPSGNAAMDALVSALWPFLLQQVRVNGGTLSSFGAA